MNTVQSTGGGGGHSKKDKRDEVTNYNKYQFSLYFYIKFSFCMYTCVGEYLILLKNVV